MVSQGQPCYYHEHRPALPHPFDNLLEKARTGTTHGNCSGSYVTYFQRDEVKRAGVRCNTVAPSRLFLLKSTYLSDNESKFNKLQHSYKTME